MMQRAGLMLSFLVICCLARSVSASQLVDGKVETRLVPAPVEYAALLPDGYETAKDLPLLFFLHGGGGDKSFLARLRSLFDEMWKAGTLPPMVVVTPSAARSFYMDYKDGSEKWETFIVTEFLDHLRAKFKVTRERKGTLLFGISMGGMGALRIGFKYPEKFGALAALEPGIDPVLKWKDLSSRYKFYRGQDLMETIFGKPFDEAYWEANNVASIALARADRLRASGLGIYLDAGDEDGLLPARSSGVSSSPVVGSEDSARISSGARSRSRGADPSAPLNGRSRIPRAHAEPSSARPGSGGDAQTP
jgi:S-formylglutathione hydrolase